MSTYATGRFHHVSEDTAAWLDSAADGLDTGSAPASDLLPALAAGGLTRVGVPEAFGGDGSDVIDAIAAIAEVSSLSLAAGFVLWGHRTYIEYLLQSPNAALRERLLPDLVAGRVAGATGLSNAMKFLAKLEELQIEARQSGDALVADGKMPWVTNLRGEGFHVAAAVAGPDGTPWVATFASGDRGVERSPDLDLFGLRATNTAAVKISNTPLTKASIISDNAASWLPYVRSAFLGLQCGMSIGLARRALHEVKAASGAGRGILGNPIAVVTSSLHAQQRALFEGISNHTYRNAPADLFRIRIALADIVTTAVGLELQALGGRAYLDPAGRGFARRWREAAFIPVITPSLVQLKSALEAQAPGSLLRRNEHA